jgi:DNA adenine methylase
MGSKLSGYFTRCDLLDCSRLLQATRLIAGDFSKTLEHVRAGDFVYLDPPYAVSSRRIFCEYGKDAFHTSDIARFGEELDRVHSVKADFLVSYADCREARALVPTI